MTLVEKIKMFGRGEEISVAISNSEDWEKEYRMNNKELFNAALTSGRPNVYTTACALHCLQRAEELNTEYRL